MWPRTVTRVITFVLIVLAASAAEATNRHVSAGGSGSRDGSDWSNACDGFTGACSPASLVRGDVYFVADGDYTAYGPLTFTKPASSTLRIWIKKAIATDHGSAAGWTDAMGNGQATFDKITFGSPYWTWDGQVGWGTAGYGFKVEPQTCTGASIIWGIGLGQNNSGMYVLHTEIAHCGEDLLRDGTVFSGPGACQPAGKCGLITDGIYSCNFLPTTDLQIRYLYIHDLTRDGITLCGVDNVLIEHVTIARNHMADAASHGQGVAFIQPPMNNATIRYCVFADLVGTAAVAWLGGNGLTYSNMSFYGNLLYTTSDTARYNYSPNALYGRPGTHQTGFRVYNNTFYNIVKPKTGLWGTTVTNSETRNNLYVRSEFSSAPPTSGIVYSHNSYYDNTGLYIPSGETGQDNGSGSPFVNPGGADFRLNSSTLAGLKLTSIYSADLLGTARGADGMWDRGAFEFKIRPKPPGSLKVVTP